jgi:hypothetical protein
MKQHVVFDIELIGKKKPVFLVCAQVIETGEKFSFWHDKRGHTTKLEKLLFDKRYTWVSFNGINFDAPLIAAAVMGHDEDNLKIIATNIIEKQMRSWQTYREFEIDFLDFDHIDLIETAPGVMISLKTYAGRMGYESMVDMPFHHDDEIDTQAKRKILEAYCFNDIGVTTELFKRLKIEIDLRIEMGLEYDLDFRSKSDAQIAEAILKKRCGINSSADKFVPTFVTYKAPAFIKTKSPALWALIEKYEEERFAINRGNGSPIETDWMAEPIVVGKGLYKVGLGGLHSQHDKQFYLEATEDLLISDFDVASYYPNIMMKAGLIPRIGGNKGEIFIKEYTELYNRRMEAKHGGNKKVANTLKIVLNGTFGKLGSIYSAFYSPDLLIAVTITGQLNLLCLIDELERIKGVDVRSANTDGVSVSYPPSKRDAVLKVFSMNARRTGFEYEETPYSKIAMKDVNNYIAICVDGKVKTKGLYASNDPRENPLYLMKNPTMEVCSKAAAAYLKNGVKPEEFIHDCEYIEEFVAIRNVKGGGIQHKKVELVDDWEEFGPGHWVYPDMGKQPVKRKSRPAPREVGVGGTPFGRVARWYMTTQSLPPLSYVGSGNKVPKTEGAKVCMKLPASFPKDLDYDWYIRETYEILNDVGVTT